MRPFLFAFVMALAALPSAANACDDHAPGRHSQQHAAGPSPFVTGQVREVDVGAATITLAHGRISSLRMQPMSSMVFKAGDAKSLANLKPGDRVKFRVKLVGDQPTLTEIALAKN